MYVFSKQAIVVIIVNDFDYNKRDNLIFHLFIIFFFTNIK